MGAANERVKLERGTIARIARQVGLSVQHVSEVAKGKRVGNDELERLLANERRRQSRRPAAKQAA